MCECRSFASHPVQTERQRTRQSSVAVIHAIAATVGETAAKYAHDHSAVMLRCVAVRFC